MKRVLAVVSCCLAFGLTLAILSPKAMDTVTKLAFPGAVLLYIMTKCFELIDGNEKPGSVLVSAAITVAACFLAFASLAISGAPGLSPLK